MLLVLKSISVKMVERHLLFSLALVDLYITWGNSFCLSIYFFVRQRIFIFSIIQWFDNSDHVNHTFSQYIKVLTSTSLYWPSTTKYQPIFERISTGRSLLINLTYRFISGVEIDQGYLSFLLSKCNDVIAFKIESQMSKMGVVYFASQLENSTGVVHG